MERVIKIVPANEEYIETAGDIAIKAWTPIRQEFKRLLGEALYGRFYQDWRPKKKNAVMSALRNGPGYIVLVDSDVAGFVTYKVNAATKLGEIMDNAVDPQYRGLGIGPMMYRHVLEQMREEGMLHVVVTTGLDDGHAPARKAYEKAGFKKSLPYVKYFMELN